MKKLNKYTVMKYITKNRPEFWMMLILLLGVTSLLYTSCQKNDDDTIDNDSFTSTAKIWFENEIVQKEKEMLATPYKNLPKYADTRIFARMEKLNANLNWKDVKEHNQNGVQFIVVPVMETLKPFRNQNFEAARAIVFFKDYIGEMQMNIVEAISKKEGSLNMSIVDIAGTTFKNKYLNNSDLIGNLSATISFYDRNYKTESSFQISNGICSKTKINIINKKKITSSTNSKTTCQSCEEWGIYLITYDTITFEIYDVTLLSEWTECTYVGEPYGEDPVADGNGNDDDDVDCLTDCSNTLDEIANGETTNEIESIAPVINQQNYRKNRYQWKIYKAVTWSLSSVEIGELERTDENSPWYFTSLEHDGIAMNGMTAMGGVEHSTISAYSRVYSNFAVMDLLFSVKISIECCGTSLEHNGSYHSLKSFNVND